MSRNIENLKALAMSPDVSAYDIKTADWAINEIEHLQTAIQSALYEIEHGRYGSVGTILESVLS